MSNTQMSSEKVAKLENSTYRERDEIDLKELIIALWKGKVFILCCIIITTVLSIIYALSLDEKWTSRASISQPQLSSYVEYQTQISQFQPVFDIYQDDGSVLVSEALLSLVDPEELLSLFVQEFKSSNNMKQYIGNQKEFQIELKALVELQEESIQNSAIQGLYSTWYKKISIENLTDKPNEYNISFINNSSKRSYDLLTGYIEYIHNKSHDLALGNLYSIVNAKKTELLQQRNIFEGQAKARLEVERELSEAALKIAVSAGVNKPLQGLGDKEIFAINLGANALKAKVSVLNEIKNLSIIEPRIQLVNSKIDILDRMKLNKDIAFKLFRFIQQPEPPLARTSPRRFMITFFGMFLGFICGFFIVLVRNYF